MVRVLRRAGFQAFAAGNLRRRLRSRCGFSGSRRRDRGPVQARARLRQDLPVLMVCCFGGAHQVSFPGRQMVATAKKATASMASR